jgi:hypothetical protein
MKVLSILLWVEKCKILAPSRFWGHACFWFCVYVSPKLLNLSQRSFQYSYSLVRLWIIAFSEPLIMSWAVMPLSV